MEAIQPIIQMDQKDHIEDIGSHEAKLKLDGPYLNHQGNAMNDEVNVFDDDLKLLKGSTTISHRKRFKEISRAKLKEALQGCMKNIRANHGHEDLKRFNGFVEVNLKLNGLYSTYWQSMFLMIIDRLILAYFGPNHVWALVIVISYNLFLISISICLEA